MSFREAGICLIDCVHKTPVAREVGYPYVAIPQMKNRRIDFAETRRISHDDFVQWTKKARPQVHDVVLSRRTNPGVTATFGNNVFFALGQNLVLLRADGTVVDPRFLRWLVVSPAWWAEIEKYNNVGAVFDSLRCADVPRFRLPIPPKPVQSQIAELLSAMDDKIELNRRTNETLEAMAQAIFRDWFVDFGPVRRKLAGATEPIEIMGGLTLDSGQATVLAEQFPDELGASDLPAGWQTTTLGAYADLNPESWSARNAPDTVEYLDLSNVKWGVIESPTKLSWNEAPSRARRVTRTGDTLVGTVRPGNGSYTYIGADGQTASTGFAQLRPKKEVYRDFTYLAATSAGNVARLASLADGAAYPAVNPSVVLATEVPKIADHLARSFWEVVSPLRALIEHRKFESRSLAETRDYLLPKLMSGEVGVSDVDFGRQPTPDEAREGVC